MLGNNIGTVGWPQSGEIDIMENHGSNMSSTSSALHGPGYSGATPLNHSVGLSSSATNFHTYAVEWDTTEIRFYVDGAQHYRVTQTQVQQYGNWVYNHPFFFILNLAVGGNFDGNPGSDSIFPATMLIDYVRMYTKGTSTVPTNTPAPATGISTTAWYNIINQNSNKCVDAAMPANVNGNIVQQWLCNGTQLNQQWQFRSTTNGYYQVVSRQASLVMDVSGGATATGDGAKVHLWSYVGGTNQQWQAVSLGGGYYRFIARHSGKCLDTPSASTADGVQLQQWTCNGSGAQAFRLVQR
jgi:beta-glucanase (GH16 family)